MGLRAAPEDSVPSRFPAPCTNSSFDCGLDGKLIDFGRRGEADTRSLIHEILEFVAPEVDELGSWREIEHIERILKGGTGADRQLAVWEGTHDMKAVVDHIVRETNAGLEPAECAPEAQMPHSHAAT